MAIMDPIADMLTRIRNAAIVQKKDVIVPFSNPNLGIINIFQSEGFVKAHKVVSYDKSKKSIEISLNFDEEGEPVIKGLKRVSKPGLRVYVKKGEIPRYYGGIGVTIMSTPNGIVTGGKAWRDNSGGEVLCYVW
mgnify:CR=1 FL=1